jgi:hypothetical protein
MFFNISRLDVFLEINMKNKKKMILFLGVILVASTAITQVFALPEDFEIPNPGWGPNHPLYGLERFIEERWEVPLARLMRGKLGEAEKRLQLAEERLAEMEAIANGSKPEDLEGLRLGYEMQMNRTQSLVNETELESMKEFMLERSMRHIEVLTYLRERVPVQARQGIDMALGSSSKSIGVQIRDRVRSLDVNETEVLDDLESYGLQVRNRIREYKDIRDEFPNVPSDVLPVDIELPVDVSELINQHRRGPP